MAKIEFGEIPQEFRHVEYLSDIILKIQEYTSDFEPYLDELKINVSIELPPHLENQILNTLDINERKGVLNVEFRRHRVNESNITPIPTSTDFYNSVVFALNSVKKDLIENDENE